MVVLSGSICTRGGKPLLSRQFRDISRDRITALLANFPSLISNSSGQHTSVEDDNVRYVYQPLEEFYIVLITNKTSNILQDIDTLHLFASTISNLLRNIDEREIFESSFEIIDAFDEIINLGYKENLTLTQVQTFLEMDSHEEKIQEIIERNKELEAAEERKRRAKEIQRKELARKNMEQLPVGGVGSGLGSSSFGYDSYQSNQPTYQPTPVVETTNNDGGSAGGHSLLSRPRGGGLQLGSKKPAGRSLPSAGGAHEPLLTGNTNQPLFAHKHTPPAAAAAGAAATARAEASPAPSISRVPNNGILISVNEKVNAEVSREGSISSSEVKGDLQLRINQAELANAKILLKIAGDKKQFKTHPNVDRNLFQLGNVVTVKDKSKTFPSNDQPLGVLRWRSVGKQDDTSLVPFIFTIWVNALDDGLVQVTLEYELTSDFVEKHPNHPNIENLKILVPVVTQDVHLQEGGNDTVSYDVYEDQGIVFNIGSIAIDDPQGSFEFTVPVSDEESLFPMQAQFEITNQEVVESDVSLGGVSIIDVVSNTEDEESLPFDLHSNITSEGYFIQ
ncbi:Coatomer subunit delta [Candida viswanathii]|uniref:Coatomer subunit delta n=1 Tax=Candida viswanathii TaxID=5486 RepID=A0A367YGY6_9ASCO|nr:Coatomer subunit delta [Candida viswanathii]